jgi:hypothetical protein
VTRAPGLVVLAAVLAVPPTPAGEIPQAILILEAAVGLPGSIPDAAPARFVLLRDRRVFVGGSEPIYAGELSEDEKDRLEDRVDALRDSGVLGPSVKFSDDTRKRYRLRLLEDDPRDVVITGDPAHAPAVLRPLATFVSELLRFDHRSLRPWSPAEYALSAREGILVGGCREWLLPVSLDAALAAPQRIAADEVERWPTGSNPASVCADGQRYVVTLHPLLPGEQP